MRALLPLLVSLTFCQPALAQSAKPREDLPRQVEAILRRHCHSCHGANGRPDGGVYILNLEQLLARKKIRPDKPDDSPLLKRMLSADDPMPPREADGNPLPRPTGDELGTVREWLRAGAKPWADARPARKRISQAELFTLVLTDLDRTPRQDRKFLRYFSLVPRYNAGASDDELDTFRHALVKLLNSLSWQADLVRPEAIDPARVLLRVDLRKLGWSADQWEAVNYADPFALVLDLRSARTVYEETGCNLPITSAEWFTFAAARPPLYHELLGLPKTVRELEVRLGVHSEDNVNQGNVLRAGIAISGVSVSNRLAERQPGRTFLYKTFDFANSAGRKNLFAFPLDARPDGGEFIFPLPNGLHGYYLANGLGQRVDAAPTNIVSDPAARDRAVTVGVSCFRCHASGFLPVADQIRGHVERNRAAFRKDEVERVQQLHPPVETFRAQVEQDNETYRAALTRLDVPLGTTEPISFVGSRFEEELTFDLATAELGVEAETFREAIERNATLKRIVGPLRLTGGTVPRDAWLEVFPLAAREAQNGVIVFADQFQPTPGQTLVYRLTDAGRHEIHRRSIGTVADGKVRYEERIGDAATRVVVVPAHPVKGQPVYLDLLGKPTRVLYHQLTEGDVRVDRYYARGYGLVREVITTPQRTTTFELIQVSR